jgi:hypothetical protein
MKYVFEDWPFDPILPVVLLLYTLIFIKWVNKTHEHQRAATRRTIDTMRRSIQVDLESMDRLINEVLAIVQRLKDNQDEEVENVATALQALELRASIRLEEALQSLRIDIAHLKNSQNDDGVLLAKVTLPEGTRKHQTTAEDETAGAQAKPSKDQQTAPTPSTAQVNALARKLNDCIGGAMDLVGGVMDHLDNELANVAMKQELMETRVELRIEKNGAAWLKEVREIRESLVAIWRYLEDDADEGWANAIYG